MAFQTGSIFAILKLDNRPLAKELERAAKLVDKFVAQTQTKLNSIRIPDFLKAFLKQTGTERLRKLDIKTDTLKQKIEEARKIIASLTARINVIKLKPTIDTSAVKTAFENVKQTFLTSIASRIKQLAVPVTAAGVGGGGGGRITNVVGAPGQFPEFPKPPPKGFLAATIIAFKQLGNVIVGLQLRAALLFAQITKGITPFSAIAGITKGFFTPLISGVKLISGAFGFFNNILTRSIFSLKNLVITIAAIAFARRAIDVENISTAFKRLSASVGDLSSNFLGKLRKATKGTISDLDLMRAANNAVLLGVIRSQEEFATLVESARILGKALGRGPVEALNDIVLGIGRQSRLILDNLGIIVRVQEAYEQFAGGIGKATSALTDQEKRLAFQEAALRAVKERTQELADLETPTADAFGRLTAAFQNSFSDIALALVSPRLPTALANFLDNNREIVANFARFISKSFGDIVDSIIDEFKRLSGSEDPLKEFASKIINVAEEAFVGFANVISKLAVAIAKEGIAIAAVGVEIGLALGKGIISGALRAIGNFASDLANLLVIDPTKKVIGAAAQTLEAFRQATEQLLTIRQPGDFAEAFRKFVTEFDKAGIILVNGIEQTRKNSESSLDKLGPTLTGAILRIGAAVGPAFKEAGSNLINALLPESDIRQKIFKNFEDLKFELKNGIASLGNVETIRAIQPIANIFNKAVDAVSAFTKRLPELRSKTESSLSGLEASLSGVSTQIGATSDGTDKLIKGFVDLGATVVLSARKIVDSVSDQTIISFFKNILIKSREVVGSLNQSFVAISRFFQPKIDTEALNAFTEDVNKVLSEFQEKAVTSGIDDATDAFARLDLKLKGIGFPPGVEARLREFLQRTKAEVVDLQETIRLNEIFRDAAKAIEQAKLNIDKLSPETVDEILQKIRIAIEELSSLGSQIEPIQVEDIIDLSGLEEKLKNIKLAFTPQEAIRDAERLIRDANLDILRINPDEVRDKLRQVQSALSELHADLIPDSEQANAIKKLEDLGKRLSQIFGRVELIDLTKSVTNAVGDGLLRALDKGESFFKQIASIGSQLFEEQFKKSIGRIAEFLGNALDRAIGSVAGSAGLAGLGGVLVGVGGLILSKLASKSSVTVDDFEKQINAAEAIRGVVAGPTNIAIAKVGESFKVALQTSEILLQRIATATERLAGGSGIGSAPTATGSPALSSSFLRLSTSTPS